MSTDSQVSSPPPTAQADHTSWQSLVPCLVREERDRETSGAVGAQGHSLPRGSSVPSPVRKERERDGHGAGGGQRLVSPQAEPRHTIGEVGRFDRHSVGGGAAPNDTDEPEIEEIVPDACWESEERPRLFGTFNIDARADRVELVEEAEALEQYHGLTATLDSIRQQANVSLLRMAAKGPISTQLTLCCKQELARAAETRAKLLDELAKAYEKVNAENERLKAENKCLKDSVDLLDQNLKASHEEDSKLRYRAKELEQENARLTQSLDETAEQLKRCSENCKVLVVRNKGKCWT